MGSHGALVHEVLEGDVSVLLELDVVLEAHLHHLVNLSLKRKELGGELNGVLEQGGIRDNLLAAILDVGLHLLNDVLERAVDSLEDTVHQGELVQFAVLEHGVATCALLVDQVVCL